jgi:hypothetical protein
MQLQSRCVTQVASCHPKARQLCSAATKRRPQVAALLEVTLAYDHLSAFVSSATQSAAAFSFLSHLVVGVIAENKRLIAAKTKRRPPNGEGVVIPHKPYSSSRGKRVRFVLFSAAGHTSTTPRLCFRFRGERSLLFPCASGSVDSRVCPVYSVMVLPRGLLLSSMVLSVLSGVPGDRNAHTTILELMDKDTHVCNFPPKEMLQVCYP